MARRTVFGGYVRLIVVIFLLFLHCTLGASIKCDISDASVYNCSDMGLTVIPPISLGADQTDNYRTLDFSNNNIIHIPQINISSKNEVRKMILRNNQISSIETKAFKDMTKLTELDISRNMLTGQTLEEKQFDNLYNIETLKMSRNQLGIIRKDTFGVMDFNSLKFLDLSHCKIYRIEVDALDLHHLKHLKLSWNELESIQVNAFRKLRQLLILDLSHNRIKIVDEVPTLPVIQTLNLDNNEIRVVSLNQSIIHHMELLEQLWLRNNDIQSLTPESLPLEHDRIEIQLDNNPINCDCMMKWVIGNRGIQRDNVEIICYSPSRLKGKNLVTISAEQLPCGIGGAHPLALSFLPAVLIVIILAFLASLFITLKRKCRRCRLRRSWSSRYGGANYTSVYTKEGEEAKVYAPGYELLTRRGREFDV